MLHLLGCQSNCELDFKKLETLISSSEIVSPSSRSKCHIEVSYPSCMKMDTTELFKILGLNEQCHNSFLEDDGMNCSIKISMESEWLQFNGIVDFSEQTYQWDTTLYVEKSIRRNLINVDSIPEGMIKSEKIRKLPTKDLESLIHCNTVFKKFTNENINSCD